MLFGIFIRRTAGVKRFLYFVSEHYGDNLGYLNYSDNTVAEGHRLAVM